MTPSPPPFFPPFPEDNCSLKQGTVKVELSHALWDLGFLPPPLLVVPFLAALFCLCCRRQDNQLLDIQDKTVFYIKIQHITRLTAFYLS